MSKPENKFEFRNVELRLHYLLQRTTAPSRSRDRLLNDLLLRHAELRATPRPSRLGGLVDRLVRPMPRLAVVVAPALAIVLVAGIIVGALQIGGAQTPQGAEAARITAALARTVPTVTSWQVQLQRTTSRTASSSGCIVPVLPSTDHLYMRAGIPYLYSNGTWYRVSPQSRRGDCPSGLEWAFVSLPSNLARYHATIHPSRSVEGQSAERVSYAVSLTTGMMRVQAWVSTRTGLVLRLNRVLVRHGRVIERDSAVYSYHRRAA
ncbi:MAG: hypothetical protein ACRDFS_03500 [Chloroflexota bacterium]